MQDNRHIEQKLQAHFAAVPNPDKTALEETVQAVLRQVSCEALCVKDPSPTAQDDKVRNVLQSLTEQKTREHSSVEPPVISAQERVQAGQGSGEHSLAHARKQLLSPSVAELIRSQIRATKGLVWIAQAALVLLTLLAALLITNQAYALGAFGAAGAILAGISIAGIAYDQNSPLAEMSYSFHYDYRQIVLVRMMVYGLGDLVGLLLLSGAGSLLAPFGLSTLSLSFSEVLFCASETFFLSGFVCFAVIGQYRGEASILLCIVFSLLIATLNQILWSEYTHLLTATPMLFWLVLMACAAAGLVLLARRILAKIDAGYGSVKPLKI